MLEREVRDMGIIYTNSFSPHSSSPKKWHDTRSISLHSPHPPNTKTKKTLILTKFGKKIFISSSTEINWPLVQMGLTQSRKLKFTKISCGNLISKLSSKQVGMEQAICNADQSNPTKKDQIHMICSPIDNNILYLLKINKPILCCILDNNIFLLKTCIGHFSTIITEIYSHTDSTNDMFYSPGDPSLTGFVPHPTWQYKTQLIKWAALVWPWLIWPVPATWLMYCNMSI